LSLGLSSAVKLRGHLSCSPPLTEPGENDFSAPPVPPHSKHLSRSKLFSPRLLNCARLAFRCCRRVLPLRAISSGCRQRLTPAESNGLGEFPQAVGMLCVLCGVCERLRDGPLGTGKDDPRR
jgi:hypothetical protein